MSPRRSILYGLALLLGLTLAGCGAIMPFGPGRGPASYASPGERIYRTGIGSDGQRVPYEGGPMWLSMGGGGCASCHGSDGRGGRPVMMLSIIPPDIRYSALAQRGYNTGLVARTIVAGLNAQGQPLDPAMPRWRPSSEDMADLLAYLKALD